MGIEEECEDCKDQEQANQNFIENLLINS